MIIRDLDCVGILQADVFVEVLDTESEVEKLEMIEELQSHADKLGVGKAFKNRLKAYKKDDAKVNAFVKQYDFDLERDNEGRVKNCISNYMSILNNDLRFKGKLRLNELSDMPQKIVKGKIANWEDVDHSKTRCYIEKTYGIYSEKKLYDALDIVFRENSYNPVKDIIESIEWDGVPRVHTILNKWLRVENNEYTREVSRLIFAGGINRLYNPGCKFDDMPVLIGTKQGEGKSTFVLWLALHDDYFREIKDIDGQKGIEVLKGGWICEMSELLALTKTKEVEAVKSYITCRVDTYRKPYGREVTTNPRKCIMIGTTNKEQFLTDKTGNRRFYPVTVRSRGKDLFDNEKDVKHDILQAWAEALVMYKKGELKNCADNELIETIREHQEAAVEDDYREGLIESYLEDKNETCIIEVWENVFNNIGRPTRKDSNEIGLMISKLSDWENLGKSKRFDKYGKQKMWEKVKLPF